jgi:hypothetical protein
MPKRELVIAYKIIKGGSVVVSSKSVEPNRCIDVTEW